MEFLISAKVTITVYTKVEAETFEEAVELALDRNPMAIVSNGGDDEYNSWIADEIDGEPYDLINETQP